VSALQHLNLQPPDLQQLNDRCDQDLVDAIGRLHVMTSALQADLLAFIAEYDSRALWERDGCRHMGQWLAGHLGVTVSEGLRWTTAAHALGKLPSIAAALRAGTLSFDKVLQLARFATLDTERDLLAWARRASVNAIRRKADLANRASLEESIDAHRERFLEWSWYDWDTRVGLEAMLPSDTGSEVIRAIKDLADSLPCVPAEDSTFEQRCADALVALCSAGPMPAKQPHVVLGIDLGHLAGDGPGGAVEDGPVLHPELARRFACDCRLQAVARDPGGHAVGIGRGSRNVPEWLMRELRFRDDGCTFPGCGTRRFLAAHHVVHWARGGATDLDNLVLVCSFHHKLVHEGGWTVKLGRTPDSVWTRPNGMRYEPGPPSIPVNNFAASLQQPDTS
jgi:Domain of unknown function (DUF222)/HNH endonuclease